MKEARSTSVGPCCSFGPFIVDFRRRLLWRDREGVALTAKTFDLLAVLIEYRDRVVEKEELMKLVWPDAIVMESNLVRQVSMLRRALGQRPDQHEYLVTISGRGYEFVADIRELACPPEGLPTDVPHRATTARTNEPNADSTAATQGLADLAPVPTVLSDSPISADPVTYELKRTLAWRMGLRLAGIGAAILIVSSGLITLGKGFTPEQQPNRELRRFTFDAHLPREAAWSPDGRRLAYTSNRRGTSGIWIQSPAESEPVRLTSWEDQESQPDWSPDGRSVAFRSERDGGGLYVTPVRGGEPHRIASFGYHPRWSPDGEQILFSTSSIRTGTRHLYAVKPDGSQSHPVLEELVAEFTAAGPYASVNADWYPDGRQISLWGKHPKNGWTFVTAPLAGGTGVRSAIAEAVGKQIKDADISLENFVWARSGRFLYFEGRSFDTRNIWRVGIDPKTLTWMRGPERLTTSTGLDSDIALSADGRILAFTVRTARTRLWSLPLDAVSGGPQLPEPVTSGSSGRFGELDPDAAQDGHTLVYRTARGARQELRAHSIASGADRVLIAGTNLNRTTPRWSPDGKMLAYAVYRPSETSHRDELAVAVLPAEGGTERLLTTPGQVSFVPMDWSRAADAILGTCEYGRPPRAGTCVLSVATAAPVAPQMRLIGSDPSLDLYSQRFSPNQRWISFVALAANDPARSTIFVSPSNGGEWQPVTNGTWYVDKPRWAADGRTLYYLSNRGGFLNVWGQRFDPMSGKTVGEPFAVTQFHDEQRVIPAARVGAMDIAIATNRLFLPITDTASEIWILSQVDR